LVGQVIVMTAFVTIVVGLLLSRAGAAVAQGVVAFVPFLRLLGAGVAAESTTRYPDRSRRIWELKTGERL
jgi:hypothetical protein